MKTLIIGIKRIEINNIRAFRMGYLVQSLRIMRDDNPFRFKVKDHELYCDWEKGWLTGYEGEVVNWI